MLWECDLVLTSSLRDREGSSPHGLGTSMSNCAGLAPLPVTPHPYLHPIQGVRFVEPLKPTFLVVLTIHPGAS